MRIIMWSLWVAVGSIVNIKYGFMPMLLYYVGSLLFSMCQMFKNEKRD